MARRAVRLGLGALGASAGFCVIGKGCALAKEATCKLVFSTYATEEENGEKAMGSFDFLRSLVHIGAQLDVELPDSATIRDLESLFKDLDSDHDGLLRFSEFSLLMTLLTNSFQQLKLVCATYDVGNKKKMSREDFQNVVVALGGDSSLEYDWSGGITEYLFRGRKDLTHKDLFSFVENLKDRVTNAQFAVLAEANGRIPYERYLSKVFGGEEGYPEALREAAFLNKLKRRSLAGEGVSLHSFHALSDLSECADDLRMALEMYSKVTESVRRRDLVRALKLADPEAVRMMRPDDVDTIFKLFGADDGELKVPEFLLALQLTRSWGMKRANMSEPRRNFPQALFKCLSSGA
eukprot:TRINITY_DN30477_c0_g1_i1.p1 TRINITY_DN30477_c0_g1~~TRINITY_DN30477_c0_g1_i1.p1  ORF type:complete len:350 (+),score=131.20 TRINITY_DN30477_c0_g1_i1:63-1112(+)